MSLHRSLTLVVWISSFNDAPLCRHLKQSSILPLGLPQYDLQYPSAHCVTKEQFVTFFLVRFFNGLLSFRQIVYFLISDSYCYSLVCLCLFSAVTALVTKKFVCLLKINMESQLFGILLGFHIICALT